MQLLTLPFVFQVVEHGMFVKHCKVEVYLLELNLCENDDMDNVVTRHFSKADTIGEKLMDSARLWNRQEKFLRFTIMPIYRSSCPLFADTIEKEMRRLFDIPAERETRLWNKYMSNTYEQLNKPDSTVQDAGLFQGQVRHIDILMGTFLPRSSTVQRRD